MSYEVHDWDPHGTEQAEAAQILGLEDTKVAMLAGVSYGAEGQAVDLPAHAVEDSRVREAEREVAVVPGVRAGAERTCIRS